MDVNVKNKHSFKKSLLLFLMVTLLSVPVVALANGTGGVKPGASNSGDGGSIESINGDPGSLVPSQGGLLGAAGDSGRKQGWIESICFNPTQVNYWVLG